jgi:hypothetical protein
MPAMERLAFEDLHGPGATLGAGVSAGSLAGVLIGGAGGRLAMLALRLTSDPSLSGVSTDDGFTIGRVSLQTLFLLGVTAGLGMAGGLFYLVVRRWIPSRRWIPLMTLFFALVGRRAHRSERGRLHAAFAAAAAAGGGAVRRDPRGLRRAHTVDRRTPAARGLDPAKGTLGLGRGLGAAPVREYRGRAGPSGCTRGVGPSAVRRRAY